MLVTMAKVILKQTAMVMKSYTHLVQHALTGVLTFQHLLPAVNQDQTLPKYSKTACITLTDMLTVIPLEHAHSFFSMAMTHDFRCLSWNM